MAPNTPTPDEPPRPEIAEPFLFGILALGIINGIFSPLVTFVFLINSLWYPSLFLPHSTAFVMMFASLITSTLTIMIAGIPAALYERFFNRGRTNEVSLWIWVSVLAVLSVPAVLKAINAL